MERKEPQIVIRMEKILALPAKIAYDDFDGDFVSFLESVYAIFKRDFVDSKPFFRGVRIALKKYPLVMGKEYTFYHITHEGKDEQNRVPSIPRMECIPYPRYLIERSEHPYLKVWTNIRKNEERILIYHERAEYLVVLANRGNYILLWTAYVVDKPHMRRKLMKEYETYKKARTV